MLDESEKVFITALDRYVTFETRIRTSENFDITGMVEGLVDKGLIEVCHLPHPDDIYGEVWGYRITDEGRIVARMMK